MRLRSSLSWKTLEPNPIFLKPKKSQLAMLLVEIYSRGRMNSGRLTKNKMSTFPILPPRTATLVHSSLIRSSRRSLLSQRGCSTPFLPLCTSRVLSLIWRLRSPSCSTKVGNRLEEPATETKPRLDWPHASPKSYSRLLLKWASSLDLICQPPLSLRAFQRRSNGGRSSWPTSTA